MPLPNSDRPPETSAGYEARLGFIAEALQSHPIRRVLDIGCGTGEFVTAPLARLFPDIRFDGVDSDPVSLEHANETFRSLKNLTFVQTPPSEAVYDLIIASEVVEHVEDPVNFLASMHSRMNPESILIVTLPNGYGCHELMSALEALLQVSGIIPFLKKCLKRSPGSPTPTKAQDTLAISPHINFFSYGRIQRLFRDTGFDVRRYRGRMFLYNFIATLIIDCSPRLIRWNISLGQRLPALLVADWMFVLKARPGASQLASLPRYRRNLYERLKLRLNCRRWHVPVPAQWLQ